MAVQTDIATQDSMGHQGFDLVTATSSQTKGYIAIQVVSAAVFTSMTGATGSPITASMSPSTRTTKPAAPPWMA